MLKFLEATVEALGLALFFAVGIAIWSITP
jgi:hypothetical protein